MKLFFYTCLSATLLLIAGNASAQTPVGMASLSALAAGHHNAHHNCPNCRQGNVTVSSHGAASCDTCQFRLYPDAGYNPPVNMPVNRNMATYQNYVPAQPYGHPGGGFTQRHPAVAQATDTSQLGYYYHQVPTWQSSSAKLPPRPVPGRFHNNFCPPQQQGRLLAGSTTAALQPVYATPNPVQTVSQPTEAPKAVAAARPAGIARMAQVVLPAGQTASTPVVAPQPQIAQQTPASDVLRHRPAATAKAVSQASTPAAPAPTKPAQKKSRFFRLPSFSNLLKK